MVELAKLIRGNTGTANSIHLTMPAKCTSTHTLPQQTDLCGRIQVLSRPGTVLPTTVSLTLSASHFLGEVQLLLGHHCFGARVFSCNCEGFCPCCRRLSFSRCVDVGPLKLYAPGPLTEILEPGLHGQQRKKMQRWGRGIASGAPERLHWQPGQPWSVHPATWLSLLVLQK